MNYSRPILTKIKERVANPVGLIQVITGPRQVGKTTIVKQLFTSRKWKGIYCVADATFQYDASWIETIYNEALLQQVKSQSPVILAIDEIQKVPNWSETIKRLSDNNAFHSSKPLQLILLGSSHWLMQKGLSESLAGRFEQWEIPHWTYQEMHEGFGVSPEEYVYFGAYPGSMSLVQDEERWQSYIRQSLIETVITKDVLLMERIDKPAVLRRVFELGASYSGQILSYNKLMGQLQDAKNTTTIAHYLDLLQRAGLLEGLQKYANDHARKRSSSPKWQVMNNALLSTIRGNSFRDVKSNPSLWGRWVESAIGCHLLAHRGNDLQVYYWNESNAEVDYVLRWKNKLIGLEVKTRKEKVTGIEKFRKQFMPHRVFQLQSGGLTWQQFLTMDPRELF